MGSEPNDCCKLTRKQKIPTSKFENKARREAISGIRILIIDHHPIAVKGYVHLLENLGTEYRFDIDCAFSCDQVLRIMRGHQPNFYDIILLEIALPPCKDHSTICGEDLGVRIRSRFSATKIFVHTDVLDQQRIYNIYKSIRPEGFMLKPELYPKVFKEAIHNILKGSDCYSHRINTLINGASDDFFLDTSDLKILYHLSRGEKMKDLPNYVPMAMATIERRKKKLKIQFGIPNGNTKQLLDIARAKGFVN